MPIYGYRCTSCAHEFEIKQSASDPNIPLCEKCGAEVKKIFFPVGIQFKGAGFYVNDSKPSAAPAVETKTDEAKPAEPDKAEPAPTAATSEKPADSIKTEPASTSVAKQD